VSGLRLIILALHKRPFIRQFQGAQTELPEIVGNTLRMAAAAKLYEMGRLSTGAAAQLAGVSRSVFLARLADYEVNTFDLDEEELDEETRLA
jgi:predicted HTH domain antitoxin